MNTAKPAAPFSCTYSAQLPEILFKLKCSIAISTYQAGKIVFISPKDENSIVTLPRTFEKPMGFDIVGDKMVLATKDEVISFKNSQQLALHYPNKPRTYDSLFVPRNTYYTGRVDLHDITYGTDGIYAVNTSFSCLCKIDEEYSFIPIWKPSFITDLVSEDRCHLNGLVIEEGKPKYVTALGTTDTHQGWRENIARGGVLMDITSGQTLFEHLAMPHSPMLYKGELYGLLSATGQFVRFNVKDSQVEVLKELEGFCRGLDIIDDYAFIGMSKLRKNSSTFAKLDFAKTASTAGIKILHLPTRAIVGEIQYQTSVDEIYEVKILRDSIRPNILNTIKPIHKQTLAIPERTFWARFPDSDQNNS